MYYLLYCIIFLYIAIPCVVYYVGNSVSVSIATCSMCETTSSSQELYSYFYTYCYIQHTAILTGAKAG